MQEVPMEHFAWRANYCAIPLSFRGRATGLHSHAYPKEGMFWKEGGARGLGIIYGYVVYPGGRSY
jgi:hypothetical protein